jgi:Copper/zinc superoxide dismutase (SODC)
MYQVQMQTYQVLFRYPIVGKILFRQPKEQPWQDTTVIVEYLIHADGSSINNTADHRWSIHVHPPDKDFYSWQNRCISAGEIYNPYKVSYDIKAPQKSCSSSSSKLCRLGDLSRFGTISIAGRKADSRISRKIFTDSNLPLSGFSSILGKSIVIFDEHGPEARGERLACSS